MIMNDHFIGATREYAELGKPVPAPMLRKSFVLSGKTIGKACLSICGLGFYVLYVNGHNVTKGHIAPYISNPDHICYYDTYDIAPYLVEGENVLGILLGNGNLNAFGGAVWDFDKAPYRGAPRVALSLSVKTEEQSLTMEADTSFRTHPSPIMLDDLRLGETYDATMELDGWTQAGFDASTWEHAIIAEAPRGELRPCKAEPIAVLEERKPVSITKQGDAYLYDFGINSAGVCRLCVSGNREQQITMWHGEVLRDGSFYNNNIICHPDKYPFYRTYNQTVRYTLSGNGQECYTPSFTYFGFRYVLVEGITEEQATEELLTYLVMSSDIKTLGGFSCSDERVNTLYRMVTNADRSNFFYFPTDCPHREKNGWTGDASMSADHMVLMYDVEASWRMWLDNIRKAQNEAGALPGIVPTGGWGFHWGNGPTWDSVLFNLPYMLYQYRGCLEVIRENAHAMLRYLSYIMTRRNEDGTVSVGLGDYVPVGKDRASDYTVPVVVTDSIMVMDMAGKAEEMFRAVGMSHEAEYAKGIHEDMRKVIRQRLVSLDTMTVLGSSQSGQCIALYYGVFEREEEREAFKRLMTFIHEKNDTFDCGFLGMHCLFHVLARFGETELAYRMIMGDAFPSYARLIDQGETAMVEKFMEDPLKVGSHNHHFQGDIARWFTNTLAGLCVLDSQTVCVAPVPVEELTYAEAWYDLPAGRVSVSWRRDEKGSVSVDVEAPQGVTVIRAQKNN